jgi:hypothetical protein
MQGNIIFFAYGGGSVIGSTDDLKTMMGFSNPFAEASNDAIGLSVNGLGECALLIRSDPSGELRYAFWSGNWVPGFGQMMTPVMPGLTILGGPSSAASAQDFHVVYQSTDTKFYYARASFNSWNPTAEPLSVGNGTSTGPVPPAVAAVGSEPLAIWVGNDGDLYDQSRSNSIWTMPASHGLMGQVAAVTPAITNLISGPELLAVLNVTAGDGLEFMTRTAGVWSAPAVIMGASSQAPVSIAALPAGGAVLAYQGVDGNLYTANLSAGMNPSWSAPVVGLAGQVDPLVAPPVVATGATGADAELYYLDTMYILHASRMIGGVWNVPAFAGAAGGRLALTTGI